MSAGKAVDLAIVGGGVAGLWLANLFAARGYRLILLEGDALGGGQTLASQGIIHGGLKYSLGGALSGATVAISTMPKRWRDNLAGQGELDLRTIKPLAERCYLFAEDSALDKLSSFLASKAMRGRVAKLSPREYPQTFKDPGFSGVVYAVDDLVIDPMALLRVLHARIADRIFCHQLHSSEVTVNSKHVTLNIGNSQIQARHLLLCAGAGNGTLIEGLGFAEPQMQLRPLHQVVVRHNHPHPMFAHCLTNIRRAEPRMTITSHHAPEGALWYLGGQLASDGVNMTADVLAAHARQELRHCVPWLDWDQARIETLRVDRAEPLDPHGNRPDQAFAEAQGPVLVCWPIKLSLTPDLGDRVQALLTPPRVADPSQTSTPTLTLANATMGNAPWEA